MAVSFGKWLPYEGPMFRGHWRKSSQVFPVLVVPVRLPPAVTKHGVFRPVWVRTEQLTSLLQDINAAHYNVCRLPNVDVASKSLLLQVPERYLPQLQEGRALTAHVRIRHVKENRHVETDQSRNRVYLLCSVEDIVPVE